jgi:hypothetical protein
MKTGMLFAVAVMLAAAAMPGGALGQLNSPDISVVMTSYDPFPAEAGRYFDLWIKVQNVGGSGAGNVTIELPDTYPFSLDPGEKRTWSFGSIDVTQSFLVQYRVRVADDAVDGPNPIKLRVSTDGGASYIEKSFDVSVESKVIDYAVGRLASDPTRLESDTTDNKLTIGLQNIGKAVAKLVTVQIILPPGFTPSQSYSDTYAVGDIASEASADAIFYVDIDESVRSGDYLATLRVQYLDSSNGDYRTKSLQLTIPVRASPAFGIENVTLTPAAVGQGATGVALAFRITNSGTAKADNVNVRILKEATQPFSFDEISDFVGNLQPGESGQAVFHFDVDPAADLKKYILDVEIRYTEDATVRTVDDTLSFSVTEPLPDSTGLYVLGILMLAAIGGAFWYYRRR